MRRWPQQPRWLRVAVVVLVLLLFYGTAVHVAQLLTARGQPYPALPAWLRLYFVSLTLLDPLAAVLLLRRHRVGVLLTVGVLVTDAAANTLANYAFDDATGVTAGRFGQAVITLLAVGCLMITPALWRATASPRPRISQTPSPRTRRT
ncbi:hypothetical protein SAMN06264364_13523 [Quadrisphaera granulorum]|uniref:Uncharacterized protein n=1 Tax=Quadrisphaera granulorum TaxID=317664 RepID=A0A315ZRT5_9ACTN|nr:hypothetical protein BXY45_13523 [Quadrisphaera granulorum]SZE98674.1 hypothetical protein SAMN06264364_13523 [Quadrisphaera granulorum]